MNLTGRHCVFEIDGVEYDDWQDKELISRVTCKLATDKSGDATVELLDPKSFYTDKHLDESGLKRASLRVWMGFGERSQLGPPLFEGLLSGHSHDGSVATFVFDDHSSRMKQRRHSRYHTTRTDLGIIRSIAKEYDISVVVAEGVPDSPAHDDCLIQFEQTDWQFMMETARRSGLRLYMRGQTLYVQEAGKTGEAVADLVYSRTSGEGDFVFKRGLGLSHKLPENKLGRRGHVQVRTRGPRVRALAGEDGDEETRGGHHTHVEEDLPEHTARAAKRRARARRSLSREDAFEHQIRLLPDFLRRRAPLKQGETVNLLEVGEFYSGKYVIRTAQYTYDPQTFGA
jgi:hypothetical protein